MTRNENFEKNNIRHLRLLELQKEIRNLIDNLVKLNRGGERAFVVKMGFGDPDDGAFIGEDNAEYFKDFYGNNWEQIVNDSYLRNLGGDALALKTISTIHDLKSKHMNQPDLGLRVDNGDTMRLFYFDGPEYEEKIYGTPNDTNKIKKYGVGKDKMDPNLDKAQYNSLEMWPVAKAMKDKFRFIMEDDEGNPDLTILTEAAQLVLGEREKEEDPFKKKLPLWLYFYFNNAMVHQAPVKEESLADAMGWNRMRGSKLPPVDIDPDKGIYLKLVMDAFDGYGIEDIGKRMGGAVPYGHLINSGGPLSRLDEKKKYIHFYNRFLAENNFPNPLTDYKVPHTIPSYLFYGKSILVGVGGGQLGVGKAYHKDDFVNVTDETKQKKGDNILFAGWKQNGKYLDDSMDYIYIEMTQADVDAENENYYYIQIGEYEPDDPEDKAGIVSGEITQFEYAKKKKFKEIADAAHTRRKRDGGLGGDPWYHGTLNNMSNRTKVCDLSYYLLFDDLLYKGKKGKDRVKAIQEDNMALTTATNLTTIPTEYLNNHTAWELPDERLGRLRKISDEINRLTLLINEMVQNQN